MCTATVRRIERQVLSALHCKRCEHSLAPFGLDGLETHCVGMRSGGVELVPVCVSGSLGLPAGLMLRRVTVPLLVWSWVLGDFYRVILYGVRESGNLFGSRISGLATDTTGARAKWIVQ